LITRIPPDSPDLRGERAVGRASEPEAAAHAHAEDARGQRQRQPQADQRQRPARRERGHRRHQHREAQQRERRRQQERLHDLGHHRAVLVRAVDRVADPRLVVEAQRQRLQAVDELHAQ
jgi:hypothetical protein